MPHWSHFFIPHKKNDFRAHFLKPVALYAVIFFLLGLQFSFLFIREAHPAVLGVSYSITTQDIISQTNDQRGKQGLASLNYNPQLAVAAQLKGQDMLAKGYWAHTAPDGREPWAFILQAGYNYIRAGENLAKDFRDNISVVNAWMNSPGHRANILNPHYKDIGVAVVSGPFNGYDTVIVVQMFGEPAGGSTNLSSLTQPQAASAAETPKPLIARKVELALESNNASTSATTSAGTNTGLTKPFESGQIEVKTEANNQAIIDPVNIFKTVVIGMGLFFTALLIIDAYLIGKARIKRKNHGHSLLHAIFLIIVMISLYVIQTGVIL